MIGFKGSFIEIILSCGIAVKNAYFGLDLPTFGSRLL